MLDVQLYEGELLLLLHGNRAETSTAKAIFANVLGIGVHLVTPGMLRRIRNGQNNVDESTLDVLARIAIADTRGG